MKNVIKVDQNKILWLRCKGNVLAGGAAEHSVKYTDSFAY